MKSRRARTTTPGYKRHGTTDLFATMNVAAGEFLYDTRRLHQATDVLAFFKLMDLPLPPHLKAHAVLHNLSAHETHPIAMPVAHRTRAQSHPHFTPVSSSRLDLLEGRLSPIAEHRLPHGVSRSLDDLLTAVETWAEHTKTHPNSFACKNPLDEIVPQAKTARSTMASVESATHH
jgi:hypothetical protein